MRHIPGVTCVSRLHQGAGNRSASWPWVIGFDRAGDGVGAPCVTWVLDDLGSSATTIVIG